MLVDFSDAVTITATSIKSDSFEVFPNSRNSYILGNLKMNNWFCKCFIAVDFQIKSDIPDTVDLKNLIIDSLVLSINIDSSYHYGDTLTTHTIKVFELNENIQIRIRRHS